MKVNKSTKLVSALLVLVMTFLMLPMGSVPAVAADSSNTSATASLSKRAQVIDYMTKMATVQWKAEKTYKSLFYTGHYITWNAGHSYYGIPYSQNTSVTNSISKTNYITLDTFNTMLSQNDGVLSKDIGRNDCSSTVTTAYGTVDSGVKNSSTSSMYPGVNNLVAVGSYTYKDNKATTCTYNGKDKMYAAYAALLPGDAVIRDGHIMLVVGVNPTSNKITVIHQSGGYKYYDPSTNKTTASNSSNFNTTWGINEEFSFSTLYNEGYIPITCKALAEEKTYNNKYVLCWPISTSVAGIRKKITSTMGSRTFEYEGKLVTDYHKGVDIGIVSGTKLYSAADGIVTDVGSGWNNGRGNFVVIYHENLNISTIYQHLTSYSVKEGQRVYAGQEIAKSGNTGMSTGAHLHYGIVKGKASSVNADQTKANLINPLSNDITYINYTEAAKASYKITSSECLQITNDSATFSVTLNNTAVVSKWAYFLSTNASDINQVDATDANNHKDTSTISHVRALDYTSDPQTQVSASIAIDRYLGKKLDTNTTYYYKIAVNIGNIWYQSGVYTFTTTKTLPGEPEVRVSSSNKNVGIGDQVTLLWNGVDGAETYNIQIKDSLGNIVQKKISITGNTCVLDGLEYADQYTAEISAINSAGETKGQSATFTVMPDVTVTFYDTIENKTIDVKTAHWGHGVTAPQGPQHEGHTFSKWDKSYDIVTENITVNTVYNVHSYTVKFVDPFTQELIGKPQTIEYGQSATAPSISEMNIQDGYGFKAWDKDFDFIRTDLTVYAVYEWVDEDNTAAVTINSIVRNNTEKGYDIKVTISNKVNKESSGRVVFVLKSDGGAILAKIESSAFAIEALGSQQISDTILCEGLAPKIEIYVVNGFENEKLGQISKVAKADIDNSVSSGWSEWIQYTGSCPMVSGSGVTVESKTESSKTADKYYYRYKILSTTTSYETSMSGWVQNGYTLTNAKSVTLNYVSSWPSGFNKSNSLYTKYNNTPASAKEDSTSKTVITEDVVVGYIYWHWCRGGNHGAINRKINSNKTSEFDTFHAFFTTEKLSYDTSAKAHKYKNTSYCNDTYWWSCSESDVITVKKQTNVTYDKLYDYYQYSGFSEWKEYNGVTVPVTNNQIAGANKTYQSVSTKKEAGVTTYTYFYRYMTTSNPVISEPAISPDCVQTLTGNVGSQFAGKAATVWVHKFDQVSNETVQYIGTTTVATDGSVTINNAKLMSMPTVDSGDYAIMVSVAGQSKAIRIGTIEAPKPVYTVKFLDFDGNIISEQSVVSGDSATLPSEELLNVPAGHKFTHWNESAINIRHDMTFTPLSETEKYVVAFVDWNAHSVELKEFYYGAELIFEISPEHIDGYVTEWVIRVGEEYLTLSEYAENGYRVTSNAVVETRNTIEKHNIIIIGANSNTLLDVDNIINNGLSSDDIADQYIVENGDYIHFDNVQVTIEENPDYIFAGWIDVNTGLPIESTKVSDNLTIYPSYKFAETVATPIADVEMGEYDSAQMIALSCETENAVIWYTTDNTDPTTSDTAKEYTEPIEMSKSGVLRFYASALGHNDSEEVQKIYAINTEGEPKYHVIVIWYSFRIGHGEDPLYGLVKEGLLLPQSIFGNFDGMKFEGVFLDEEYQNEFYLESETITESTFLWAKYSYVDLKVEFRDYDGTLIEEQNVSYLNDATPSIIPEREGYVFIGWDNSLESITENSVLTAVYVPEDEYAEVTLSRTVAINLPLGKSIKLEAIVNGGVLDYEMVWSSSDDFIVTVNEAGNIYAKSVGSATVSVELPYTRSMASIEVNVIKNTEYDFVLKEDSVFGFDNAGYLRITPQVDNSVSALRNHFENENLVFLSKDGEQMNDEDVITTGAVVQVVCEGVVATSTTVVLTGDFNCDGLINNKDIVMLNQYLSDLRSVDEFQMLAVDVNGDGYINANDASMLNRYLVGKEVIE